MCQNSSEDYGDRAKIDKEMIEGLIVCMPRFISRIKQKLVLPESDTKLRKEKEWKYKEY